ncbi:uncharacterized protein LOC129596014 [Paramacrobiotus metropolitanus]|uniref:uncharacterized protein LOC129596014 n=1 Tax=Paramacrobiotus metropolitanus TaxID=2943436 RepID=UPI0024462886|nr:uncharacterized protein LOC129596014 [Paramacrobiotus metropolitanus]
MLRIVCAVVLLAVSACAQGPEIPDLSQFFGPNCTADDVQAITQCTLNMQNQTQASQAVLDQFGGVFLSGNITEEQAKAIMDASCNLVQGLIGCLRPMASRCFTQPYLVMTFIMYDDLLAVCEAPNRYKYFAEIVRCNKRLDVYSTITNDQVLANITQEIVNASLTSLGPNNNNTSGVLDMYSEFTDLFCRVIRRVEELVPLEKVNGTCGANAHEAYSSLYPHILQMYKCTGDELSHNTTATPPITPPITRPDQNNTSGGGNGAGSIQPANGYALYSLFTFLLAIVLANKRD